MRDVIGWASAQGVHVLVDEVRAPVTGLLLVTPTQIFGATVFDGSFRSALDSVTPTSAPYVHCVSGLSKVGLGGWKVMRPKLARKIPPT